MREVVRPLAVGAEIERTNVRFSDFIELWGFQFFEPCVVVIVVITCCKLWCFLYTPGLAANSRLKRERNDKIECSSLNRGFIASNCSGRLEIALIDVLDIGELRCCLDRGAKDRRWTRMYKDSPAIHGSYSFARLKEGKRREKNCGFVNTSRV